eukprot:TRINITY_DN2152_c0_g1_i2.p1 TRINITY_DN2152_c0_g1~~TRINITY_DN2152_c0_g1_i2.p1  ORF type:complete len:394 (+),score=92.90 TRINITY_DN2152_c0_g1_i2:357-1538(+)
MLAVLALQSAPRQTTRGFALVARGFNRGAWKHFMGALALEPDFVPALLALRSLQTSAPRRFLPGTATGLRKRAVEASDAAHEKAKQYFALTYDHAATHRIRGFVQSMHGLFYHFVYNDNKNAMAKLEEAASPCCAIGASLAPRRSGDLDDDELRHDDGCMWAMNTFGVCLCDGDGVPKDMPRGATLLTRAAEKGHVSAISNLGQCYLQGEGVSRDKLHASELFEQAASFGNRVSLIQYGYCIENGFAHNVKGRDPRAAFQFYKKAAELGDKTAMYNVGIAYLYGSGIDKNIAMAHDWIKQAAEHGDRESKKLLRFFDAGEFEERPEGASDASEDYDDDEGEGDDDEDEDDYDGDDDVDSDSAEEEGSTGDSSELDDEADDSGNSSSEQPKESQ